MVPNILDEFLLKGSSKEESESTHFHSSCLPSILSFLRNDRPQSILFSGENNGRANLFLSELLLGIDYSLILSLLPEMR